MMIKSFPPKASNISEMKNKKLNKKLADLLPKRFKILGIPNIASIVRIEATT